MPSKMVQIINLPQLLSFSMAGFLIAIKKRELFVMLLTALFFSPVLLHVLVRYIDLYRVILLPVLLLIVAYGFLEEVEIIRNLLLLTNYKLA
ncbi:MAG: hypothetical protein JW786_00570 [Desulfobacterales bacterium]|nr:hypothetical protein [Desulfobacterales bacterium]